MRVYFTRDSVCAGDDGDAPHALEMAVPDTFDLEQLVNAILAAAPLPSISGGNATWCASSAVPLAVIAQQWEAPRFLHFIQPKLSDLDVKSGTLKLHFTYFAQLDPDTVFEVLKRLQLRAG